MSNNPNNCYQQQAKQAALELDFGLGLATSEAECRDAISAGFEAMPEVDVSDEPENSIYNFNEILDTISTQ